MKLIPSRYFLYLAWLQALVAMLGSLFYSEVLHLTPCILCWYQRILLYPLVLIIGIGIIKKDKYLPYYVLPMSLIGQGIALFHWLLQMNIIPDHYAPCINGISCASKFIDYYGFITIPFMSLVAFTVITASILIYLKLNKKVQVKSD